ncbi:hypothetical protein DVJ78_18410 (plasmid) [Humibacter sp. BT305]|nr:hypothetical protein DVJ78_18410 [Humibacter sp. BT305]
MTDDTNSPHESDTPRDALERAEAELDRPQSPQAVDEFDGKSDTIAKVAAQGGELAKDGTRKLRETSHDALEDIENASPARVRIVIAASLAIVVAAVLLTARTARK